MRHTPLQRWQVLAGGLKAAGFRVARQIPSETGEATWGAPGPGARQLNIPVTVLVRPHPAGCPGNGAVPQQAET